MFKKEDIKLVAIGIIASAYMTIFYDLIQEFAKPSLDVHIIMIKALGGLASVGIGVGIVYYLTSKKR